jgi:putative protease
MKLTTYARSLHDLNLCREHGVTDVILEPKSCARFGVLTSEEFITLSKRARELGLRVLLEWDILMVESTFAQVSSGIQELLGSVDTIRVQDPGALEWCLKNTTLPLQFIAENGNHNLKGLQGWIDLAEGRMERIILSIELSQHVIEEYVQKLTVPCELLGLGRILLFYTPRQLLSPLVSESFASNEGLSAVGESEESPHKGFPIVENRHGTFMFHIKEFCLLEYRESLAGFGLGYFRIDLRWAGIGLIAEINRPIEEFKDLYPQDLMRGFYLVNKTDVLFPKLKNHRLQKREGNYLGEVMDAEKGEHLAILVKNARGMKIGDRLRILHPKGEEFSIEVRLLRNLALEPIDHIDEGKICLIPYINGVWVKSQVFLA